MRITYFIYDVNEIEISDVQLSSKTFLNFNNQQSRF